MIVDRYSEINKEDTTLRLYQQKGKREIFEAWDEVDSVMFQMPTGTGKTRLFTSIISDINKYSINRKEAVKILIIAHRTELIKQISESLKRYQVAHHLIVGGKEKNYYAPVVVASIQTITNSHNIERAKKLNVQFVIIDEAHHALAASYKKLWSMYPDAKRLGVTATPWRMNHQSFTDLFDKLILSMPVKDFINQGFLAPYKYFSLKDNSSIQKTIDDIELDRFGEYKESSMEEKMDIGSIRAQLLDSYLSLAKGKKGIIYAINIVHAKHICEEYKNAGFKAVSIDSKTPAAEREDYVNKFKNGEIDIIVNVDIFSEGFDCPDIEFIQLARPTRSLVKYLQQVGRGLRITKNKQNCVILDNVGMYSRFGLPDARRHWKHHFLGQDIDEEPTKTFARVATGRHREIDMSEGTEDMELIQDVSDVEAVAELQETHQEIPQETHEYDPNPILKANNYKDDNFIFWDENKEKVYEAYIQDNQYFIISELMIDETKHRVRRNRVGKIIMSSWMFWQMERYKVDNLKSIEHYGGNYTVFHYQVLSTNNKIKDKYFDYKGQEISTPIIVQIKYEQAKRSNKIIDYIDVPVSKAKFTCDKNSNTIIIYLTKKGITKVIATVSTSSDFGKIFGSNYYEFYWSDNNSFSIKYIENGKTYIYKYDIYGKLIKKGTFANNSEVKKPLLNQSDIEKLGHVFDSKATSYKYFWFLSVVQLFYETKKESIPFKQLIIRMVANAWKYVSVLDGEFPKIDQLPRYINEVKSRTYLTKSSELDIIEKKVNIYYSSEKLNTLLSPLLNNVPYRFLSPWIPFKSNDDVIEKSNDAKTRCPYSLHDNCITINEIWRKYIIDHYDEIISFIEKELKSFLKSE